MPPEKCTVDDSSYTIHNCRPLLYECVFNNCGPGQQCMSYIVKSFYNLELILQMMSPSDVSFYCKFGKSNIETYVS